MVWALLCFMSARMASADNALIQLNAKALSQTPTVLLSPSGQFVAMQDSQGGIWLLEPAKHSKRLLCRSKRFLDQTDLALSWSPDNKELLVTRNGILSIYSSPGGRQKRALKISDPVSLAEVSPNGRYLSFIRNHNLWLASLDTSEQRALTNTGDTNLLIGLPDPVYAYEFGIDKHYWWSPDSSAIAFIETEFHSADHYPLPGGMLPHFRLRILNVSSGALTTVCESSDSYSYLLRVVWHPDSKHLAFYRMNRTQNEAELNLWGQEGQRSILTEKDAYWVNVPAAPLFVSNGEGLVVTSEQSGERRAYVYKLDGELVRQLSPAGLEVYRLFPVEDDQHGVYVEGVTGNKQDQHLFRLDLSGGEPKQLTEKSAWHDVEVGAKGNVYVDTVSSAAVTPSVWWHSGTQPASELSRSEAIETSTLNDFTPIKTHDNVLLPARLFKPANFDATRKYPVIIYTFAGPRSRVVKDSWDGWQMAWNRYLVSQGYLVLAVDVRGSGGYGHSFEEYIHYRFGAQETVDLREVVSYLRRQSYVDPQRLGVWGCDYGAHTVVHAMLQFPHGFQAGYADSPITDWRDYDAYFAERYLGLPRRNGVEYDDSSPLESPQAMTGQLLVAASPRNPIIRQSQVQALIKAVAKATGRPITNQLHVLDEFDVDYRRDPEQLAKLLQNMYQFFSEMY